MYPERDSQAEAFDDAYERQRTGDTESVDDQEIQELVNLAARLEQELPDDLPDPGFRENLKNEILRGEIHQQSVATSAEEPVNLEDERWFRRLVASPWRLSAAAAACFVVILVAFASTAGNPFSSGPGESSEDITSFQAVDSDDSAGADDPFQSEEFPLDIDDSAVPSEQWFTASLPPFDTEHVVLPPLLLGFLPFSERHQPRVELNGIADMVGNVEMPDSGTVYYLNAPPDGPTMLTTLSSTLGIRGELVESNGNGEPLRIVDANQNDILRWDPTSAFFHFQGGLFDEPVSDLLDPGAPPVEVAQRFLELIGFDLYTIDYEEHLVENGETTEVHFRPVDFPTTGLEVNLGGIVLVDDEGAVLEAQLYWLSLVDVEVVALRDVEEIIADIENYSGFAPPVTEDSTEMVINVADMTLVHILTRLGDSHFVLQPAVKVVGDYANDVDPPMPGPARYLVPAIQDSN
jgi:hypothetical protein